MGFFRSSPSKELHVGATGNGFIDSGPRGFRIQFLRMCANHKTSLANMSDDDKELLYGIIVSRMRKKVTGSKISSYDRKLMRFDAQEFYHKGQISNEDLKDFNQIINSLKK